MKKDKRGAYWKSYKTEQDAQFTETLCLNNLETQRVIQTYYK